MRIFFCCLMTGFIAISINAYAGDEAIDVATSKLDVDLAKMQADIKSGASKDILHADRAKIKVDQAALKEVRKASRAKLLSGK